MIKISFGVEVSPWLRFDSSDRGSYYKSVFKTHLLLFGIKYHLYGKEETMEISRNIYFRRHDKNLQ